MEKVTLNVYKHYAPNFSPIEAEKYLKEKGYDAVIDSDEDWVWLKQCPARIIIEESGYWANELFGEEDKEIVWFEAPAFISSMEELGIEVIIKETSQIEFMMQRGLLSSKN